MYTLSYLILARTLYNAYFIFILQIKILRLREVHHWAKILLQNNDSIYFKNIWEYITEKLEECILKGEEFSFRDGIMENYNAVKYLLIFLFQISYDVLVS